MAASRKQDALDRLVIFLAKRDGIDKLVKTFQYVSKLAHWRLQEGGLHPSLADRAKKWEVSCGTSRKAFRSGRFLSGLNALRGQPPTTSSLGLRICTVLSNGGEMVYFFFDHLLWLARIGLLDAHLAGRMSFISAFGEAFGYIFFIVIDLHQIRKGLRAEKQLLAQLSSAMESTAAGNAGDGQQQQLLIKGIRTAGSTGDGGQQLLIKGIRTAGSTGDGGQQQQQLLITEIKAKLRGIRAQRVTQVLAIAANLADLVIALAEIEPNPVCNHALTLGISGLVSAWSGWYRNWPSSS